MLRWRVGEGGRTGNIDVFLCRLHLTLTGVDNQAWMERTSTDPRMSSDRALTLPSLALVHRQDISNGERTGKGSGERGESHQEKEQT